MATSPETEGFNVEFDIDRGTSYLSTVYCCVNLSTVIGILCMPCAPYCGKKVMVNQSCTIDDKRIHVKSGWINKEDKLIPLDRVQDVNVQADCCMRCFGVSAIAIQTAGAGNPGQAAEATLIAPKDPLKVRSILMEKRDKLVLGHTAHDNGVDFVKKQPSAMIMEVQQIRESVQRIEQQLAKK
ncbi:hypothetical protein EDD86DRAFT_214127 [Gorgonomyces haynaldii]|nr:hypothetical protein EDD86DRAFT_214127 [Gorgonomyces haynaldii]